MTQENLKNRHHQPWDSIQYAASQLDPEIDARLKEERASGGILLVLMELWEYQGRIYQLFSQPHRDSKTDCKSNGQEITCDALVKLGIDIPNSTQKPHQFQKKVSHGALVWYRHVHGLEPLETPKQYPLAMYHGNGLIKS